MKIKKKKVTINPEMPVYTIGVVSELVQIPVWTLRVLDIERVCCPKRTKGKTRLYSMNDLELLNEVHRLMEEEGVNIKGIRLILEMMRRSVE